MFILKRRKIPAIQLNPMMFLPMTRLQMKSVSFAQRAMLARAMEKFLSPPPFPVSSAGAMDFCMNLAFPMYPCNTARAITIQPLPFRSIHHHRLPRRPHLPLPFPSYQHHHHLLVAVIIIIIIIHHLRWLTCLSRIRFRIVTFAKRVVLAMELGLNQAQPWPPLK